MRRVIKIGGSLLHRDSLAASLRRWVRSQPVAENFAIVGGGDLIEAIRRLDAIYPDKVVRVHWQCVELLRITYQWLGRQLDDWTMIDTAESFEQLRRPVVETAGAATSTESPTPRCHLIDINSFYREGGEAPLPENWSTTTDAIAGWLAILLQADELVLLKSCPIDRRLSLRQLADRKVIDAALPDLADELPAVRLVHLANESDR